MRWINGLTYEEKMRKKENWHRWFAWFPVIVGITPEHRKIKIWLNYVERKGIHHWSLYEGWWLWEYREIK